MTLAEYLADYASASTREKGLALIERELARIPREQTRAMAARHVREIMAGEGNDFRF